VRFDIEGDAKLYAAFQAHLADIGVAFSDTLAIKDVVATVAGKTASTFSAIGDIGAAGAGCVATQLQVAAHASASINVSVQASATVSGSAS
jgi:hypothetical protein